MPGPTGRADLPELPDLSHVYSVTIAPDQDPEAALEAFRADPHVEYAQLDYAMELDALVEGQQVVRFDDPFLATEGSWGQPYADLWGLEQIRAPEAWLRSQGEGIVVAVIDTGLDRFHPDIAANVWVNPGEDLDGDGRAGPEDENGIDDDGNGFIDDLTGFDFANSIDADEDGFYDGPEDSSDADPFDDAGHGTHVTGTIGAVADNGLGIVGVAPRSRVMSVKAFPAEGPADSTVLWRAVLYAAEMGAHVINGSWSCGTPCPVNPLADEVLGLVGQLGTTFVTSAGNATTDVVFNSPENGSDAITVGALGYDEQLADFSNRGWGIDVVAPGGGPNTPVSVRVARRNILSLLTSAIDPADEVFAVGDDYWRLAGTSMSSPHVAGAVALVRSLRPELSSEDVRRLIRMTARDIGLPGHDPVYGAGALDLAALLETELPDLALGFDAPRAGALLDPAGGPALIRGRAEGADLDSVELAVARGVRGRVFEPLVEKVAQRTGLDRRATSRATSLGVVRPEPRVLARWDLRDVESGPHVLRLRARLLDGRLVDEYLVLGVEGARPVRNSGGDGRVGLPALSGRRLVWPIAESPDATSAFDLAEGVFRASRPDLDAVDEDLERRSRLIVERERSQEDVALDGRNLVWRIREGTLTELEWCRLPRGTVGRNAVQPRREACDPTPIALQPGFVSAPWAAGGWLVWQRDGQDERIIEGCRVGRRQTGCLPEPLVREGGVRWTLRSFDGQTLLLQGGGRTSLCTLAAVGEPCTPVDIALAPGTPGVTEPVHDGRLMAFKEVTIEPRPAPGCLPGDQIPECQSSLALLVRHHACLLDSANRCESIPISQTGRVDSTAGLATSGRRIMWSMATDFEEPAVRFCEFQASPAECVEQRVSGSLARQDGLAIDGPRLVWRDARAGQTAVFGYALPDLGGPDEVRLTAGRPFSIALHVRRGTSPFLDYSVEAIDGLEPSAAKARVVDAGKAGGRVELRGILPGSAVGRHRWRVRARGEGDLWSAWTIELEVVPPPSVVAGKRPVPRFAP